MPSKGLKAGGHKGTKRQQRPKLQQHRPAFPERPGALPQRYTVARAEDALPPAPVGWTASFEEWLAFDWLTRVRRYQDGLQFQYQKKVDGGRQPGGQVVDFILYDQGRPLALMVDGRHWHLDSGYKRGSSVLARMQLIGQGWDVVIAWDDDLLTRRDFTMEMAVDYHRDLRPDRG